MSRTTERATVITNFINASSSNDDTTFFYVKLYNDGTGPDYYSRAVLKGIARQCEADTQITLVCVNEKTRKVEEKDFFTPGKTGSNLRTSHKYYSDGEGGYVKYSATKQAAYRMRSSSSIGNAGLFVVNPANPHERGSMNDDTAYSTSTNI